ncbi:tripartite tricarboxylate transporter TctB family protein [Vibrio ostreae]|uniref:Tripartite tricarboxylate transporter TctB family protein n=1 Tax=Vibrio ostreae TaxID=2841925 RepID=A0A975U883_9VIBR|nr:tripartite tricarboxylate transporter TctB family protein [Vibrio ostreae]QXO17019.1 tripartite tricarboxylate transporter TctB family protein [Vibrio ostreae]
MRLFSQRSADFSVLIILALFVCWYSWDSYHASSAVENLVLIAPIALVALALCLMELIRQFLARPLSSPKESLPETEGDLKSVLPIIALFTVYVLSLEKLGFDIATTLFVGLFLWIQKERRLIWLIGYSVAFGLLMSTFFAQMLPYPMPMSLLPTDY